MEGNGSGSLVRVDERGGDTEQQVTGCQRFFLGDDVPVGFSGLPAEQGARLRGGGRHRNSFRFIGRARSHYQGRGAWGAEPETDYHGCGVQSMPSSNLEIWVAHGILMQKAVHLLRACDEDGALWTGRTLSE